MGEELDRRAPERDRRVRPASNIGFISRMVLLIASQESRLTAFIAVLVFGLLIGVFGHIIRSRSLILTGIIIIGAVSAYFSFVLQPGAH
jgi:hypothetical protein